MKKKIHALLPLALSAVLLCTACTGVRNDPKDSGTGVSATSETLPESAFETNPTDTDTPAPPFPTDAPEKCLIDLTGLSAGEAANTYLLDFLGSDFPGGSPSLYRNLLLTVNQSGDSGGEMPSEEEAFTTLSVINLSERRLTAQHRLQGLYSCGFLENGNVYCIGNIYADNFSASILDQDLNRIYSFDADESASVSLAQFSSDGAYLAYTTDDLSHLFLVNTKTGELRKLEVSTGSLFSGSSSGKYLYLNRYDAGEASFLRVNPETGEITEVELQDTSYARIKDGITMHISGDLMIVSGAENPGTSFITEVGEDAYAYDCKSGRICVTTNSYSTEDKECSVYDIAANRAWRLYPKSSDGIDDFILSDQGFAILQYWNWEEGSCSYVLWDYLSAEPEDIEIRALPDGGISRLTEEIAGRILEKTGITVFYGGAGNDFDASDYVSKTVTDAFVIYNSIREVEAFFEELPDGMAQEMCTSSYKGIRLYLCGKLYRTETSGITTAAALTFSEGSYRAIAIDIALGGIRQNLAHEISHIIDDRMNELLLQSGPDLLGAWEKMCPDGFTYPYSYNDENGELISDTQYTAMSAEPDENVWFVDAYAKSFPTEDRARVFENLFEGNTYALRGEHLMQKAKFYCAMLRYAFPSVRNAENLVWEQLTGRVDPDDFSDIFTSSGTSDTDEQARSAANIPISVQNSR